MYCCDAVMFGVNRLPPLGSNDFSLGVTAGAGAAVEDGVVVVLVVGVVEVSGAFSPLLPQAAVKPTIAMIAVPPAAMVRRRTRRSERIVFSPLTIPNRPTSVSNRCGIPVISTLTQFG